jgi:hypothetical protein
MKGTEIFDLNNKKAGDVIENNKIKWITLSLNAPTDLKTKTGIQNAFDYLEEKIKSSDLTVIDNVKDTILIMKTIITEKGKNIKIKSALNNMLTDMFGITKKGIDMELKNNIKGETFFSNLKKIYKQTTENGFYILFLLEKFLSVQFFFKDEEFNNVNMNEIDNLEFSTTTEKEQHKKILVLIKKNIPYISIVEGMRLNTKKENLNNFANSNNKLPQNGLNLNLNEPEEELGEVKLDENNNAGEANNRGQENSAEPNSGEETNSSQENNSGQEKNLDEESRSPGNIGNTKLGGSKIKRKQIKININNKQKV